VDLDLQAGIFIVLTCVSAYSRGHSAGKQKQDSVSVGSGDVVIVNSSSYIDILYLAFR
jgi:translation initiation factor IF-1